MPLSLDSTLSGEQAESYVSKATADEYHEKRYSNQAWSALTDDDKVRALIGATDLLERLNYKGETVSESQKLKFPRYHPSFKGGDGSIIPPDVVSAVCELAVYVSDDSSNVRDTTRSERRAAGITSVKIGKASETYGAGGGSSVFGSSGTLAEFPPGVARLIQGWVKAGGHIDSGRRSQNRGRRYVQYLGWIE